MGNTVIWVKFDSLDEFNTWHETIKTELGLPKRSVDAEGNEIEGSLLITDYVLPIIVDETDVRACIAEQYAESLTPSENPVKSNYEANPL